MSILFALFNGFLWSLLDLLRKKSLKHFYAFEIAFTLTLSQLIFFSFFIFFNLINITSLNYLYYLFPLIFLNTISLLLFLKAIKLSDISLSIPLLSFTPLFALFYAYIFLGENPNYQELTGIFLILLGVFFLYSKNMTIAALIYSPVRIFNNYSARFMIIISLIWSLTPVLDKKSLEYTNLYFHGFLQSLGTIIILFIFVSKNNISFHKYRKFSSLVLILSVMIVGFLAVIVQLYALGLNNVALLEATKRALGIILAVIFGYLFFQESINQQKIIGVLLMVSGIVSMYINLHSLQVYINIL